MNNSNLLRKQSNNVKFNKMLTM